MWGNAVGELHCRQRQYFLATKASKLSTWWYVLRDRFEAPCLCKHFQITQRTHTVQPLLKLGDLLSHEILQSAP